MVSAEAERAYENGLRILARMIARAYRQELAEKKAAASLKINTMEEKNAYQRNKRGHQVTTVRQDQAGDQGRYGGDDISGTDRLLCLPGRSEKGLRRKAPRTADHVSD
jgi:hypothetical protein